MVLKTKNGEIAKTGSLLKKADKMYEIVGFDGFYGGDFNMYLTNITDKSHVIMIRDVFPDGTRGGDRVIITPKELSEMNTAAIGG